MPAGGSPPGSPKRSHFQPATWIGGQRRRRLVRRSGSVSGSLPRSNTTPILYTGVSATSSLAMSSAFVAYGPATHTSTPQRGGATPVTASPTPTTATEGRKKRHILDVLKPKERPESSHASEAVVTSPLPPLTPKAAKMLGVDFKGSDHEHTQGGQDQTDGKDDSAEVRPALRKKLSLPWLSSYQNKTEKQTKFKEEGLDETDPPTASQARLKKSSWKGPNKKAMRMLDLIQPRSRSSQRNADQDTPSLLSYQDQATEIGYNSDNDIVAPRRSAPRPIPAQNRKSRTRRKGPKSLEKMSPITEASLSEDGVVVDGDINGIVLEAISEDEKSRYVLDEDDISQLEDDEYDSQDEYEGQTPNSALLNRQSTKLQRIERPEMVHVKSHLQELERVLLNNEEKKRNLDLENRNLELDHIEMKREFRKIKARSVIQYEPNYDSSFRYDDHHHVHVDDPDDPDDSDSEIDDGIGSDIDLDEEPTLHIAQPMTFTRITPGMVKLVDIPPRKSKIVAEVGKTSGEAKSAHRNKRDGVIVMGDVNSDTVLAKGTQHGFMPQKKGRLPREESLNKVKGLVDNYDYSELHPRSDSVNPALLADQEIPPAPLPKDLRHIPKVVSPKHHCVHNGHVFRSMNLKRTPDNVGINDLEVSPYLQTPTGAKQHVDVPVRCEKCGFSVTEELWECDIPACRLTVCRYCAEDMEEKWQERAVDSWDD
ncbi:hypothetical protein K505DRAFT_361535 [Melanomma pulvis-pyrius CBS 109.77]|uniref:Uncharacterized protein n=1 Tax=Melanomma pulvis-pyrius CBS 109.77 TaxID=1314802 RepID=A0A6A6XBN7_9PLEO|nr:hypothetical protein K505DRAFT_361535 [Melanomma pulvis-pyrius CBS 109.77]